MRSEGITENNAQNNMYNVPKTYGRRYGGALMNIEGFRTLNRDIETIINKSDAVKKARRKTGGNLSKEKKKELTQEEKKYKSLRKQIQDKLIKFATRIPVFMYLTDTGNAA